MQSLKIESKKKKSHPLGWLFIKKERKQQTNIVEDVEELDPLGTADGTPYSSSSKK